MIAILLGHHHRSHYFKSNSEPDHRRGAFLVAAEVIVQNPAGTDDCGGRRLANQYDHRHDAERLRRHGKRAWGIGWKARRQTRLKCCLRLLLAAVILQCGGGDTSADDAW